MPRYAVQFIAHDEGEIEAIQEVLLNTFDIEKGIIHILELDSPQTLANLRRKRPKPPPTSLEERVIGLLTTHEDEDSDITPDERLDLARHIVTTVLSEDRRS